MIRPVRPSDRPVLETLQRSLEEPAPKLLDPTAGAEILVSTAGEPAWNREGIDPETPVGYLLWFPGEPVYVAELVVAPGFRREGRGRKLFAALFATLTPSTLVRLQVAAENEDAQSLYRSLGFEFVERDPDAYESDAGLWMATVVE